MVWELILLNQELVMLIRTDWIRWLKQCANSWNQKLFEADTMSSFVEYTNHDRMGKGVVATTLSIGHHDYWSQVHIDNDFYFTYYLMVLAPED